MTTSITGDQEDPYIRRLPRVRAHGPVGEGDAAQVPRPGAQLSPRGVRPAQPLARRRVGPEGTAEGHGCRRDKRRSALSHARQGPLRAVLLRAGGPAARDKPGEQVYNDWMMDFCKDAPGPALGPGLHRALGHRLRHSGDAAREGRRPQGSGDVDSPARRVALHRRPLRTVLVGRRRDGHAHRLAHQYRVRRLRYAGRRRPVRRSSPARPTATRPSP